MTKLIILDRDGVINKDSKDFVKTVDEWVPLPQSIEAMALLYRLGYTLVIATNQSGIGRGLLSIRDLNAMHNKMQTLLGHLGAKVDAIFFCPHHPDDVCECRKPLPGMFQSIAKRYGKDNEGMHEVYAVGDSLRDLQAAHVVHCQPVLVLTGNGQTTHAQSELPSGTQVFKDLMSFALSLQSKEQQP